MRFVHGFPAGLLLGNPSDFEKYKAVQHRPLHFLQSIFRLRTNSSYLVDLCNVFILFPFSVTAISIPVFDIYAALHNHILPHGSIIGNWKSRQSFPQNRAIIHLHCGLPVSEQLTFRNDEQTGILKHIRRLSRNPGSISFD